MPAMMDISELRLCDLDTDTLIELKDAVIEELVYRKVEFDREHSVKIVDESKAEDKLPDYVAYRIHVESPNGKAWAKHADKFDLRKGLNVFALTGEWAQREGALTEGSMIVVGAHGGTRKHPKSRYYLFKIQKGASVVGDPINADNAYIVTSSEHEIDRNAIVAEFPELLAAKAKPLLPIFAEILRAQRAGGAGK